jgi:hypothetical protein
MEQKKLTTDEWVLHVLGRKKFDIWVLLGRPGIGEFTQLADQMNKKYR